MMAASASETREGTLMLLKLPCLLVVLGLIVSALAAMGEDKKLVLIAGKQSHGPGDHEFRAGCMLLKKCLEKFPGLQVVVETNGWVADPKVFDGAAAVVLFSDGGGGHPYIQGDHSKVIGDLAKKGVGIGMLHFAVEVLKDKGGPQFLEWTGGYYEDHFSCNPMWSPDYQTFPDHPATRGVKPYSCHDEWYMHMRFRPEMKPAVAAWLQLDPLNNPAAPSSPFRMTEYAQKETAEVARQEELAAQAMTASREARGFSDDYALLTVVFASVLFFGGIARAFDSRPLRTSLAALAVLLFLGNLVVLATMPVCHE